MAEASSEGAGARDSAPAEYWAQCYLCGKRRRLPWEDVVQIDAMIEELQEEGVDVEQPRELSGESSQ